MFGWLKNLRASKEPLQVGLPRRARFIRARYDAATSTENNRRHWANADALSADAAASPEVRRTLRNRARYEVANNSYARTSHAGAAAGRRFGNTETQTVGIKLLSSAQKKEATR